jgi:hypothetical protein
MFCGRAAATVIFGEDIAQFLTFQPSAYEIRTITNAKRS